VEWEAAERAAKSAADELAKAERAAAEKVRDEARRAERLARGASGDKDGGEDQEDDGAALKNARLQYACGRPQDELLHARPGLANESAPRSCGRWRSRFGRLCVERGWHDAG
jgi:hypothetical protein